MILHFCLQHFYPRLETALGSTISYFPSNRQSGIIYRLTLINYRLKNLTLIRRGIKNTLSAGRCSN